MNQIHKYEIRRVPVKIAWNRYSFRIIRFSQNKYFSIDAKK